jgi:hypothetical protein
VRGRALLARAPEPGNMWRPNAVPTFFARWQRWQAEAHQLAAQLERALAEQPAVAPTCAQWRREAPGRRARPSQYSPAGRHPQRSRPSLRSSRPSGHAPAAPVLVAALRARFGCSRATSYRALRRGAVGTGQQS